MAFLLISQSDNLAQEADGGGSLRELAGCKYGALISVAVIDLRRRDCDVLFLLFPFYFVCK